MDYERVRETPPERIPWHCHERDMCRLSDAYMTAVKVLIVALVMAVVFCGLEAYMRHKEHDKWLTYLEQYDFAAYDYTQDGEGVNIIGNKNGVEYNVPAFESESQDEEKPRNGEGQGAEKGEEMRCETEPQG